MKQPLVKNMWEITDAVFEKGVRYPCQRTAKTREHITITLCVVGDGTILPPNLIFKGGFPKSDVAEDGPKGASYAKSLRVRLHEQRPHSRLLEGRREAPLG